MDLRRLENLFLEQNLFDSRKGQIPSRGNVNVTAPRVK